MFEFLKVTSYNSCQTVLMFQLFTTEAQWGQIVISLREFIMNYALVKIVYVNRVNLLAICQLIRAHTFSEWKQGEPVLFPKLPITIDW